MDEWHNKKLEEIGKIYSGSTPSTNKQQYWNGDIVWITPDDLSKLPTPYLFTSERKITKAGLNSSSLTLLPPGSIVISSRAPIGYLAIPKVEFCTNQGCKSIDLKVQNDSEFAYYNILFNLAKLKNLGEGTTFAEISKTALSKIELPFPDNKVEQTYIAVVLSMIDKRIEQTEALLEKQTRIKTGLMQDLLIKGIDDNGNIRSEKTHKFQDSPLGRIPAEWEVKSIDEIAYVTKLAGFEFTEYFNYIENGEIIALRALNIKSEKLDLSDIQRISRQVSDKLPRSKIHKDDILITYIGAYIGDILRIEENDKFHLAPNVAKIVAGQDITPEFLEISLRSNYVRRQIRNLTAVTATPSLTMKQIRLILITLPICIEEQRIITNQISDLNNLINNNILLLEKLKRGKKGLMHDLLTGKVRVTELLKEREPV